MKGATIASFYPYDLQKLEVGTSIWAIRGKNIAADKKVYRN